MRSRRGNPSSRGNGWERPPAWAVVAGAVFAVGLLVLGVMSWRTEGGPAAGAAAPATRASSPAPARAALVPVQRPDDGPLRVLFIGDSLMWGSFASHESLTYRALIGAALEEDGPVAAEIVGGPGESAAEAAERADAVLLLTEWQQYRELDPVAFGKVVKQKRVLDGRNALDRDAWTAAGWSYRALGRRHG